MTAQVDLVLNDGQASPAAVTFTAAGSQAGLATWFQKTAAIVDGYFKITHLMRWPQKPKDPIRHSIRFVIPTVATETVNSVNYTKVVRQAFCSVDFVIPGDATLQERKDIRAYVSNALASTTAGYPGNTIIANDPIT